MSSYVPLYTRPKRIKYTMMAQYVDYLMYREQDEGIPLTVEEVEVMYMYIYHLAVMLASKRKFFSKFEDYDKFGLWWSSDLWERITNRRQFKVEEGERQLSRLKSILNYMKITLYGSKVEFQQEEYQEIINSNTSNFNSDLYTERLKNGIQDKYYDGLSNEIKLELKNIPQYIKDELNRSSYKYDSILYNNLYISLLMSFVNTVTFRNNFLDKIDNKISKDALTDAYIERLRKQERKDPIILWNVSPDLRDYTTVLYRKISKKFIENINKIKKSYELDDMTLQAILNTSFDREVNNNE